MDDNDLQKAIEDSNWTGHNGVQANCHATTTVNGTDMLAKIADTTGKLPLQLAFEKCNGYTNDDLTLRQAFEVIPDLIGAYTAAVRKAYDNNCEAFPLEE